MNLIAAQSIAKELYREYIWELYIFLSKLEEITFCMQLLEGAFNSVVWSRLAISLVKGSIPAADLSHNRTTMGNLCTHNSYFHSAFNEYHPNLGKRTT